MTNEVFNICFMCVAILEQASNVVEHTSCSLVIASLP